MEQQGQCVTLSHSKDGMGYFYGQLPDGRQLNVRNERIRGEMNHAWFAYVQGELLPVARGDTKFEAARLALQWALENPR